MIARRARRSLAACALGAALALAGCADPAPPAGQLDGNFIIGDATAAPDGAPRDALPRDVATDAGAPDDDATTGDRGPNPDAEAPRDGSTDAEVGIDADPPDPCARTTTVSVTARALVAQAARLDGVVVEVVATATIAPPACTDRACPPDSPCCNACTAEVWLDGVLPLTAGACVARAGCTGDECNLVCSPPVLGFSQTFRGVVRASPRPRLELMRVLP